MAELLNLSAVWLPLEANAGDDISLPFTAKATNTTGWTFAFNIYLANATGKGPSGTAVGVGTVTNTPNTGGGDSSIAVAIAAAVTASLPNKLAWYEYIKTNAGSRKCLVTGTMYLKVP